MSRELAKWMRTAGITITSEIVGLREKGINNYLKKKITAKEAIDITKLYFTGNCNKNVLDSIVDTFNKVDNTFSDDMKEEIGVLAGIIIYELIERGKQKDIIELIEMHAEIYQFLGYSSRVNDISEMMKNDLESRMLDLRENLSFEHKPINGLDKDFCFAINEDEIEEDDTSFVQNLNTTVKKINELVTQVNSINTLTVQRETLIYEDLQLLWWLMTECSDDKEERYSDIEPHLAAILAGKDLAKRVSVLPGPYSAKALLRKILYYGVNEPKSDLETYIEAVDDEIILNLLGGLDKEVQTPMLYALKKKMENGEKCWMQSFSKEFLLHKEKYSIVEVAYEIYIECLILNALQ